MSGKGRAAIEIQSLRFAFGSRQIFEDLSCRFAGGEISVVMGGSGCGKTTLLRLIGGLQSPDAGTISLGGEPIAGLSGRRPEAVRRRFGMLFQGGALLDSMTIFENVALPLREHLRLSESEVADGVHRRLHAVGLEDVDHLLPGELSGGMLRRAALARAIVMDPEILLCDEPFSGLDPPNVDRIEGLLTRLNRELGLSVIVSSHHMASSLRMGHRIVLLSEGRAVSGTPSELATSHDSSILQFLGADGAAYASQIGKGGIGKGAPAPQTGPA